MIDSESIHFEPYHRNFKTCVNNFKRMLFCQSKIRLQRYMAVQMGDQLLWVLCQDNNTYMSHRHHHDQPVGNPEIQV